MKQVAEFIVGSNAFFKGMPDYKPKDEDVLYIMTDCRSRVILHTRLDGKDMFLAPVMDKEEWISSTIDGDTGMQMGKFMVPDFAKYIGLTIEDLKRFGPYLGTLDNEHEYYKVIYDAYLENGDFVLTDDQRMSAFEKYKKYRTI